MYMDEVMKNGKLGGGGDEGVKVLVKIMELTRKIWYLAVTQYRI